MYDVVVLGAGPVGSSAARFCAEHGLKTLVVEEHDTIGYPVQCAGLLSNGAFAECGVSQDAVCCTVSGARVYGSGREKPLSFDAGVTKAYVVDRGVLDREIAQLAATAGVEFRLKTSVTSINEEKKLLHTAGGEGISYDTLIAADGPRSVAARSFGVPTSSYIYSGIQAEIPYCTDTPQVSLYPNMAPDFFAWMIPVSASRARIGLCGTHSVPDLFAAFRKIFPGSTNTELVTGTIPLGIRKRICGPSWMLAGDAAGFPKPTSGGGIYTGIRSARHAADTALESRDSSDTAAYETRCRNDFGRELDIGLQLLKFRRNLVAEDVDRILSTLNTPEILTIITQYGDMDRPSLLIKQLMHRPELLSLGTTGVKGLFRMIFSGH